MKIGDIVKDSLTEQVGVVIKLSDKTKGMFQVFWYTQGLSMFVNSRGWATADQVEVLCK